MPTHRRAGAQCAALLFFLLLPAGDAGAQALLAETTGAPPTAPTTGAEVPEYSPSDLPLLRLDELLEEGAVDRVRPKLMTVFTTIIGLLPVMFGTETGAEVMKRIATPMVGGLVSSTILTLVVIPAIYAIVKGFQLRGMFRAGGDGAPEETVPSGELVPALAARTSANHHAGHVQTAE